MVLRAKHLIEKRDGRTEGLRATKLARSILLALDADDQANAGRSMELSRAVLDQIDGAPVTPTDEVAATVERVLCSVGLSGPANTYACVGLARRHRRPLTTGSVGVR